ncbi:SDR family oxidoreductase [Flavihumibacter sp. R14]|nr:SDR family oxidoreductase [Flavihumibacter soli]
MKEKPSSFPPQEQQHQPGKEHQMTPQPEYINKNYKAGGKLQGKIALITGGDSGIGRAVSVHFAREGADVAIIYLDEQTDAEDTRQLVENESRRCLLLKGDVTDPGFCRQAVEQTTKELGGLNILVNNAAQQYPKEDLREIDPAQLDKTFKTNIYAYFYLTQEALKHLEEGDSIINTTSVTAYRGSEHLLDYSSTKGAIVSFTRSLGKNLAPKKIRVNGVAPGPVWTPLIVSSFDDEHIKKFGSDTPMGRAGQPSEIAPAYVYLACNDSSYVTGQIIHINGGEVVGG